MPGFASLKTTAASSSIREIRKSPSASTFVKCNVVKNLSQKEHAFYAPFFYACRGEMKVSGPAKYL